MTFVGDCRTDGAIRVEGTFEGSIRAGRTVVVGPGGLVTGDVRARDATVAGTVHGTLVVEGRLDIQETSRVEGEVFARTVRVGEGAVVNASVRMGEALTHRLANEAGAGGPKLHGPADSSATA
jgi:cytoskeletal protein CcmA (bactofilin family)